MEELYRAAAPKLFHRALLLAQGDRMRADDLIQLVFQAVIVGWETVSHKDPGEQMAWLYKVLHYKAADAWRARSREYPATGLILDELQSPQDTAHHALCSVAVDRALKVMKEMPPVRHRVACLRLLSGLPTEEVAEILGITQSTVRGHLKAARDELGREVGPISPFAEEESGGGLPREGR